MLCQFGQAVHCVFCHCIFHEPEDVSESDYIDWKWGLKGFLTTGHVGLGGGLQSQ